MKENNARRNINCAIMSLAITLFVPTISNAMRYTKKHNIPNENSYRKTKLNNNNYDVDLNIGENKKEISNNPKNTDYSMDDSNHLQNPNKLNSSKKKTIEKVQVPIKVNKTNLKSENNQNSKNLNHNMDTQKDASYSINMKNFIKNIGEMDSKSKIHISENIPGKKRIEVTRKNKHNKISTKTNNSAKNQFINNQILLDEKRIKESHNVNNMMNSIKNPVTEVGINFQDCNCFTFSDAYVDNTINDFCVNGKLYTKPKIKKNLIMNSNKTTQKNNSSKIDNFTPPHNNKHYDKNNKMAYHIIYDRNKFSDSQNKTYINIHNRNNTKMTYREPQHKQKLKMNLFKKFNFSNNENNYNRNNYNINNYMKIKPNNQNIKNKKRNIQCVKITSKKPINKAKTFNRKYSPQSNIPYKNRQQKENKQRFHKPIFQTEILLKTLKNIIQQFGKLMSFYTKGEVKNHENSYLEENYDKITTKIKIHNGIVTYVEEKQKYDN